MLKFNNVPCAEVVDRRCFIRKVFLKCCKIHRKTPVSKSLFKQMCRPPAQVLSCEFYKIFKSTFFYKTTLFNCFCMWTNTILKVDNRGNRKALKCTHKRQYSSCQNENIFKYIHLYSYKVCIFEKENKFPF